MRIVHATSNICGVPLLLMKTQRRMGHHAASVLYMPETRKEPEAIDLWSLLAGNRITTPLRRARVIAWVARTYDVFHFHFHTTFAPAHQDVAILKALGKRIIFHLHGCDIRDPRRTRVEHRLSACTECTYPCMVPVKLRLPETLRRYADATIVATPDLLEFVPGSRYLPEPVDTAPWESLRIPPVVSQPEGREWLIVHAPTNREIKGTRHVIAAVEQLRSEGMPVRLQVFENMPQEQLRQACVEADLVVDQLFMGWIGIYAMEMMALGKPVVAYIRPDLAPVRPDLPIEHAEPDTLAETLRQLILSPERRADLARRGPGYVRATSDPEMLCSELLRIYQHGVV